MWGFFYVLPSPFAGAELGIMTNKELDALVAQELEQWGITVLQRLAAEIKKKDLVLSGETLKSLQADVLAQTLPAVNTLHLIFQESGRIKDMKNVNYKNQPPVDVIAEYVKRIGLKQFDYVPGYDRGTMPISQQKAINRIAWGIAIAKQKNNTHKPKKWFSKPLYSMIDPFIDQVVTHYQRATGETLSATIKLS